jgi:molybdopterin-containing oxidoreductase family iron-sulfur binding subunit
MGKVPLRAHLGLYADETAEYCHWHVPEAHFLESWGDGRAFDGTVTLQQPLIEPLYGGKTALEVVAALATTEGEPTADELVRGHWQRLWQLDASADPHHFAPFTSFEEFWKRALHDGLLAGSVLEPRAAAPAAEAVAAASRSIAAAAVASPEALELAFRPDPTVWDGRFANNGWLQECPKPITKLTWDNALLVAPLTAERLGLRHEDLVEVTAGGRRARLPVWVLPGQAAGTLTVHLGYGRRRAGRVGSGAGFDAYALRGTGGLWLERGVAVRPTGERYRLASTQLHNNIPQESEQAQARHLVRVLHPDELDVGAERAAGAAGGEGGEEAHGGGGHGEAGGRPPSIYPEVPYTGYAWGMAIDLDACTGCNACVVACQAENNVPVVGKEQVLAGREMHWLRIDRYYQGSLDDPAVVHQPVLCMHCELAPCEVVCPVAATVHSAEGLNDMIYNRCVGTRYCSNNCPYKVRRFNFLHYSKIEAPVLELLQNPDVTVRSRGVMEKCTYCVQRINQARIRAGVEGRKVRDGEIVTACQQACPTQAIVFGDVNDPQSQVAAWKAEPANYTLLDELGTRPRTSYLARLRSPSPDLEGG